jgi:hypothetical protein
MIHSLISRFVFALFLGAFMPACDRTETTPGGNESRWHRVISADPADGSRTVHMMIAAENRLQPQKDRAALILGCEDGTTNVYVIWRQYLGSYDLDVTWRVGSGEEVTEQWSLSTDNEAIFAPEPVTLIKSMLANEVFLIKTAPFGSGPETMIFNTAGLEAEIPVLQENCDW